MKNKFIFTIDINFYVNENNEITMHNVGRYNNKDYNRRY